MRTRHTECRRDVVRCARRPHLAPCGASACSTGSTSSGWSRSYSSASTSKASTRSPHIECFSSTARGAEHVDVAVLPVHPRQRLPGQGLAVGHACDAEQRLHGPVVRTRHILYGRLARQGNRAHGIGIGSAGEEVHGGVDVLDPRAPGRSAEGARPDPGRYDSCDGEVLQRVAEDVDVGRGRRRRTRRAGERNLGAPFLGNRRDLGVVSAHDHPPDPIRRERVVDRPHDQRLPRDRQHVLPRDALRATARGDQRQDATAHRAVASRRPATRRSFSFTGSSLS